MRFWWPFKRNKRKKKIGIAFGGGGARGLAHIGAIKAFEENGIEFDEVSGTSAGSLIGALYAYGVSADTMIEFAKTVTTKDILTNRVMPIQSKTDGIEAIIKQLIGDCRFDELVKPLTVVAVDLIAGSEVHLTSGNVAKAVASSCAVPGIFKPVEYDNYRFADGGLQNTIPADVIRNKNCDIVISIDVNSSRGQGTSSTKLMDIMMATLRIMMKSNAIKGEMFSDIVIKPDLKKFKSTSLEGAEEMIQIGYEETIKLMPKIKYLLKIEKTKDFEELFDKNRKKFLQKQAKLEIKREKQLAKKQKKAEKKEQKTDINS